MRIAANENPKSFPAVINQTSPLARPLTTLPLATKSRLPADGFETYHPIGMRSSGARMDAFQASSSTVYTVRAGDTLTGIAQRFGVTVDALQRANGITNPNLIFAGQTLTIPGSA